MENGFNDSSPLVLLMAASQIKVVECRGGRDASLSRADNSIMKVLSENAHNRLAHLRQESSSQ
jgi:hypothetical protein